MGDPAAEHAVVAVGGIPAAVALSKRRSNYTNTARNKASFVNNESRYQAGGGGGRGGI